MLNVQEPAQPGGSAKPGSGGAAVMATPAVCTHDVGWAPGVPVSPFPNTTLCELLPSG